MTERECLSREKEACSSFFSCCYQRRLESNAFTTTAAHVHGHEPQLLLGALSGRHSIITRLLFTQLVHGLIASAFPWRCCEGQRPRLLGASKLLRRQLLVARHFLPPQVVDAVGRLSKTLAQLAWGQISQCVRGVDEVRSDLGARH